MSKNAKARNSTPEQVKEKTNINTTTNKYGVYRIIHKITNKEAKN
jgi:hypothetical protein